MKVDILKQPAAVPSSALENGVDAATAIGEPVPHMTTKVLQKSADGETAAGIWECTPGKFARVSTAEQKATAVAE